MSSRQLALALTVLTLLPSLSEGQSSRQLGLAIRECHEFFRTAGANETSTAELRIRRVRAAAESQHVYDLSQSVEPTRVAEVLRRIQTRLSPADWVALADWPAVELLNGDVISAMMGASFISGQIVSQTEATLEIAGLYGQQRSFVRSSLTLVERLASSRIDFREGEVLRALNLLRYAREHLPSVQARNPPLYGAWRLAHRAAGPLIGQPPLHLERQSGETIVGATKDGVLFGGVVLSSEWIAARRQYLLTLRLPIGGRLPTGVSRDLYLKLEDLEYLYRLTSDSSP